MSKVLPEDLDCVVAVEQVTDYLEGAMAAEARSAFEQHLVVCPGCVEYLRQIKAQVAASPALRDGRPPAAEVTQRLLDLFRGMRREGK